MPWTDLRFDFTGVKVLVTGGTSGIGATIAAEFADAGAEVTITGRRGAASDYAADLSRYRYLPLDLESDASIDAAAQALPALDILVNNAGLSFYSLGLDERDLGHPASLGQRLSLGQCGHVHGTGNAPVPQ